MVRQCEHACRWTPCLTTQVVFNLSEASLFLTEKAKRRGLTVRECFANEKPRVGITRLVCPLLYPAHERYLNRYAHTVWVVREKTARF